MQVEIPHYIKLFPVINVTPETIFEVLKDLLDNSQKEVQMGIIPRKFVQKWHASEVEAKHFNFLFKNIIKGNEG